MGRDIISLDDLTANNVGTFRKINSVCLPTSYPESFYKDALNSDQISLLAFYSELPVGAVKAKPINTAHRLASFESTQQTQPTSQIVPNAVYIESLAVLEAYRGLGIGSKLLEYVVEETKSKFVHDVVLHVHVANEQAIAWYEKKGFVREAGVVEGYYKAQGLERPDAVVLAMKV